jgi:hypothetical protein
MPRLSHLKSTYRNISATALAVIFMMLGYTNVSASCNSIGFNAAPSYKVLNNPGSVAIADFNGDGWRDVVVTNGSANKVTVMLGNGAGGFSEPTTFAGGSFPASVAVGDFNKDAKPDIVTANFSQPQGVSILLGDGTGNFAAPVSIPINSYAPGVVAVGDFNNDLNDDLVVGISEAGTLLIMLGDGAGHFSAPATFTVGTRPQEISIGDFNLDGNLDLAVRHQFGGSVWLLPGDGTGSFGPVTQVDSSLGTIGSVTAKDFNNDGKLDLAASSANKVAILLNNGDGTFAAPAVYGFSNINASSSIVAGDFNNDGKTDLAVGHTYGVVFLLGNGAGAFSESVAFTLGAGPTFLAVDDFNGDGSDDLILASYSTSGVTLLLNNGTGDFISASFHKVGSAPNSVLSADFNNDGKRDLAVANRNDNNVSILLGDGAGGFATAKNFSVGAQPAGNVSNQPYAMTSGDFNNDGKLDLVTANFTGGGVSVLLGDGLGNFTAIRKTGLSGYPWGIVAADFNNDGKLDAAISRDAIFDKISILPGDGAGSFGDPVDLALSGTSGPRPLAVGDFNGDNKPDIAVGNPIASTLAIFINNGAGGFGAVTTYPLEIFSNPLSIAIGDFNGDSKADLITANEGKDKVSLFLGDGTGKFSAPVYFNVGIDPNGVTAGDFNGDGKLDAAVANTGSAMVSILEGNGAGSFSPAVNYATSYATSITAADFNADGRLDLATDGVDVLMNSCTDTAAASLPNISIGDVTLNEDAGGAVFTVQLSNTSAQTITVQYYSLGQSATSGADFQAVSGTLTFAPGVTSQSITVPITDDAINELAETFEVDLYHPVNAAIKRERAVGRIIDNSDPVPSIIINDASVAEGNSGTTPANFNLTLSAPSGRLITLRYSTADGTASAGTDYQGASSKTLNIGAGSSSAKISIAINGDFSLEPDETFTVNLTDAKNSTLSRSQATGTITNDDASVQLSSSTFTVNETDQSGFAAITVTRTGATAPAFTVDFLTSDNSASTPCQTNGNGIASDRCDYATAVGTLRFASGEMTKTIQIPLVNDAYVEPDETFIITLRNPQAVSLGTSNSTVTIKSDDTQSASQNPIDNQGFFIKQQYIDFLGRVAEQGGFDFWMNRMNNCPVGDVCDRIDTSKRFFQSDEFQERGFYVYRLYDAVLGRLPKYAEFVPDVARLNGFQTVAEQRQSKDTYLLGFITSQEFQTLYGAYISSDGQFADPVGFVNALCAKAGITPASKQTLINNLQTGVRDPAHTVEDFILTPEMSGIGTKYYDRGFITMQYFGYLRRDPEPSGFDFWVGQLIGPNAPHKQDYRFMVGGFLQSDEYCFRFAQISSH